VDGLWISESGRAATGALGRETSRRRFDRHFQGTTRRQLAPFLIKK
jgi:hypothetical protein